MPQTACPPVQSLVERTGELYTRPAVAMEIVRLTAQPQVDAAAICECLAGDPALTAKLLKVVNSSIYGLKSQVSNLTQAVALVGVRPLKLLVLGFSLPDDLLQKVDPAWLTDYWTHAVTRSIIAKRIAEMPGAPPEWRAIADEALVAGLLEGAGQLVLLAELGDSYAAVMQRVKEEPSGTTLSVAEVRALGFDHRQLSAALLRSWNLPEKLAAAIEHPLVGKPACPDQALEAVLELAGRMTSLVVDRRLSALPDLLERGKLLCGLTRTDIQQVLQEVQPKSNQLAEALGVELLPDADHTEILLEAHTQLATVAEGAAARLLGADPDPADMADEQLCRDLLEDVRGLAGSMQTYLAKPSKQPAKPVEPVQAHAARPAVKPPHRQAAEASVDQLSRIVSQQIDACRTARLPLSLAILQLTTEDPSSVAGFRRWWKSREDAGTTAEWVALCPGRIAVLMPRIDRRDAVKVWTSAVEAYSAFQGDVDVGVAGVALASKGFAASSLIEPAGRCLDAAIDAGVSSVKSIEVY